MKTARVCVFLASLGVSLGLTTHGSSQDAKPLVIQGELTVKNPFDKVRKESRAKTHELELKAGEIYLVELKSGDFDTFLRLEDAAGKKISENDDISEKDLNSRLGFVAKKAGTYRAIVTTYQGGITGKYTLHVGTLKKVGEPKVIEAKLTEKSLKNKNDKHYALHKIEFKADELWLIDLMSKDFDPLLVAISPKKKLIAFDDDGGEGLNARLLLGIRESGEHLLQATAVLAGAKGDYSLRLQRLEQTNAVELAREERWREEAVELSQQGLKLYNAGRLKEALEPWRRALELHEKLYPKSELPKGHPDLATSLNNLATLYRDQGEYAKAESMYKQALEIRGQLLGENHPSFALILNQLAFLYREQGDFAKAEPLYRQALEINRQVLGERNPNVAANLNNLAAIYNAQGDYAKAGPLYKQALEINRQVLGEKHPDFASSLNGLASHYRVQEDYAKAEPLYKQALEINRHVLGPRHPTFATNLNNLAMTYAAQADYSKAEPLYKQALEIRRQVLGEKHPDFARSLNNLALIYNAQADYSKAEPLLKQALETNRQVLGEKHSLVALSLNNLAALYYDQRDFPKAELLYKQALEIRRQVLGEKHPELASSLNNMAALYYAQGNLAKAEPLFQQALEIERHALGEKHPAFAARLNSLAMLHLSNSQAKTAEPLGRQAAQIIAEHMDATAAVQTELRQTAFLNKRRMYLNHYLSFSAAAETPAANAYAILLPWKGAVTTRQRWARFARTDLADSDKEKGTLFTRLNDVTRQYANLINRPVDPKTAGDLPKRLRELDTEREKLEVELAQRTEGFRKLRQAKRMTPAELQKALPAGTVLVDFLVHRKSEPKNKSIECLAAFVVTPKQIERIELGDVEPTTKAIDAFLLTLKRGQPLTGETDPAIFLRDKLWQPIAQHVEGAKIVLISPDGPLCRLPFGALPGKAAGKYLIEEIPIAIIPVPQMLPELLANASTNDTSSLLVMGNVDFDAVVGKPAKATGPSELTRVFADASERSGKALQWSRLPGTLGEMNAIEKLFRVKSPKAPLTVLKAEHATEAALRSKATQHAYLHLATHGFFAPPQVKRMHVAEGKDEFERDKRPVIGHLPSLLSGLVLAGANHPGHGDDDGILTALEVGELDLSKVRLAVLSACETGLGETAGGEGVLGLQRAFQIAGAQTTVTTLWSIPDEPTRILMERFYENHWSKNMGKLDALIEAQQWMLREGRSHAGVQRGIQRLEKTPEPVTSGRLPPYYWAAFVLSGDWR